MSKWTREYIIRELLRRESADLPLSNTKKSGQGVDPRLYKAAVRIFGSWRSAVMAAGINLEQANIRERWSIPRIQSIIRMLARRHRRMSADEIQRRYGNVADAARKLFGSWPKAILAAGVDPAKILRVLPWTRERVIATILTRVLNNKPLHYRGVEPASLVVAGVRIFGSWESALLAAGLDPTLYVDHRNQDRIARGGPAGDHSVAMSSTGLRQGQPGNPHMGPESPLSDTNTGTGTKPRCWSDQGVLEAIVERLHQQQRMNAASVYREDKSLYRAASKRYRNWSNALRAAGLNPDEFRKSHSVSSVR